MCSRYSDYDGYLVYGYLVDRMQSMTLHIDLLSDPGTEMVRTAEAALGRIALLRFQEQSERYGIPDAWIASARLDVWMDLDQVFGLRARVETDLGRTFEATARPRIERLDRDRMSRRHPDQWGPARR